jgi:hypothetical protein
MHLHQPAISFTSASPNPAMPLLMSALNSGTSCITAGVGSERKQIGIDPDEMDNIREMASLQILPKTL